MTVYLMLWKDRHTDIVVEVYATIEAAKERADEIASCYHQDRVKRETIMLGGKGRYRIELSGEGDWIEVREEEVQS